MGAVYCQSCRTIRRLVVASSLQYGAEQETGGQGDGVKCVEVHRFYKEGTGTKMDN